MNLNDFCNSCHRPFTEGMRRWRFIDAKEPLTDVPHFCQPCAFRVGIGAMEEVFPEVAAPPEEPTPEQIADKELEALRFIQRHIERLPIAQRRRIWEFSQRLRKMSKDDEGRAAIQLVFLENLCATKS